MKKTLMIFLLGFVLFTLTGCGSFFEEEEALKQTSYLSIDELRSVYAEKELRKA